MIKIKIIFIGTLKEKFFKDAFNEYQKRLATFCKFELIELDEYKIKSCPSEAEIEKCLEQESLRISAKIPDNSYVIAMCIEGTELSSQKFARYIENIAANQTSCICFIVGSSHGLAKNIKERADFLMSMSAMTFPHQLARVMLCEQIYRAFQISAGGKYHK